MLEPYLFICSGDISRLRADAVVYSTSIFQEKTGDLYSGLCRIPGFQDAYARLGTVLTTQAKTAWISCGGQGKARACYGVVAVATRGSTGVTADDVAAATTSALGHASTELKKLDESRRDSNQYAPIGGGKRLIAMPSLGTGSGDAEDPAAELAARQIAAVAEFQRENPEFDVVIVAYRRGSYDRLRQARDRNGSWATHEPVSEGPTLEVLSHALREGTCIPFLGAGMSMPSGLPSWGELLAELETKLGIRDELRSPLDRAHHCHLMATKQGRRDLHLEYIHERFAEEPEGDGFVPNLAHYFLSSLEPPCVATTNYDPLIEQTLLANKRSYDKVVLDTEVAGSGGRHRTTVIKLHGCAGTRGSQRERGIVFTKDEYEAYESTYPAKVALLRALLLNHHFLFLGYGLGDDNLNQIIDQVKVLLGRTQRKAYVGIVDDDPSETAKKWDHIEVIRFAGNSLETRVRSMWIWLDRLGAATVGRAGILSMLVEGDEPIAELRARLEAVAETAEDLHRQSWTPEQVQLVVPVYEALETLGHSPRRSVEGPERRLRWWRIWKHLADQSQGQLKRRLLERALASAPREDGRKVLRQELEALRDPPTS